MTERELFVEALSRPDPAEQTAFLDGACRGDGALRRRVEALLARAERDDSRLDRRPADLIAALADVTNTPLCGAGAVDATAELATLLGPSDRPGALGRVARYDVLEVLGRGGFGIVVKAFDTSLHRVVAIKFLAPALAATSPPRQRFLREARAAARVTQENVVRVHAVEERPVPYLVMKYVEGQTLQGRLDKVGPLPAAEVVLVGRQVALGLAAAHEKGLIHRDVKPANVLLDAGVGLHARLTDFGLARATDDASMTASGVIAGTPMYMAPEQANGEVLDPRADLFSLGSVLYTLVAGRPPFRAANAFAVLKRVTEDNPRPLAEVLEGVPPGLVAVITRLLAKKPADRFSDAREAADALATCLTAPPPAPPRRRRRMAVVAVLLALAAVSVWAGADSASRRRSVSGPPAEAGPAVTGSVADAAAPPANDPVPQPPYAELVVTKVEHGAIDQGSLVWAIREANSKPGDYLITFAPELDGRTIPLIGYSVMDRTGRSAFQITKITIQGPTDGRGITLAGPAGFTHL